MLKNQNVLSFHVAPSLFADGQLKEVKQSQIIKMHNLITHQGYAAQSTTLSVSESFCSPEKYKEKLGYSRMYITEFSLYFQLFGRSFQMPVSSQLFQVSTKVGNRGERLFVLITYVKGFQRAQPQPQVAPKFRKSCPKLLEFYRKLLKSCSLSKIKTIGLTAIFALFFFKDKRRQ